MSVCNSFRRVRWLPGVLGTLVVAVVAAGVVRMGGAPAGAVPLNGQEFKLIASAEPALWAVLTVRIVAGALALWWLGLMLATWLAALQGRDERAARYAKRLPTPLRVAVTLSLSPVLISIPATLAGAQQQPPSGVPTSTTALAGSGPVADTNVLELSPVPAGPDLRHPDPRSPTVGTAPAPASTPAGVVSTQPPEVDAGRSADNTTCPTIVTRSDVHWFEQARAHLDEALGRPSSTQEAEAYWDRCVVHNADRLPDPGVPDVVPPGRLLELPELPRTL